MSIWISWKRRSVHSSTRRLLTPEDDFKFAIFTVNSWIRVMTWGITWSWTPPAIRIAFKSSKNKSEWFPLFITHRNSSVMKIHHDNRYCTNLEQDCTKTTKWEWNNESLPNMEEWGAIKMTFGYLLIHVITKRTSLGGGARNSEIIHSQWWPKSYNIFTLIRITCSEVSFSDGDQKNWCKRKWYFW